MRLMPWLAASVASIGAVISTVGGLYLGAYEITEPVGVLTVRYPDIQVEPQEDERGFNCLIHGNKICGPVDQTYWYDLATGSLTAAEPLS